MSPDDYMPQEHRYSCWEGEVEIGDDIWLVSGYPCVLRDPLPGRNPTYTYWFDDLCVYPAEGDAYRDDPLAGEQILAWRVAHEARVAERACEEQQDRALVRAEEAESEPRSRRR